MVLYKRKHFNYAPSPPNLHLAPNTEVWEIPQTGEIFDHYEAYLKRRDFYHQRNFTCEITGHSNLTFFDALESETQNSRELDSTFPEPLRGPVLRKVQHSTIGRVEQLVNWVFDDFKHDFFTRERVTAHNEEGDKIDGIVQQKITFPSSYLPDGRLQRKEFSQYHIAVDDDPRRRNMPAVVVTDGGNLYRDRRHFSKQILRSFLKNSLTKESWHGAPWQVKEKLAHQYRIPTEIPTHLQYQARMAEKKLLAQQKKAQEAEVNGSTFFNFLAAKQTQRPLDMRPHPNAKGPRNRFIHHEFGGKAVPEPASQAPFVPIANDMPYGPPGSFRGLGLSQATQAYLNGQYQYNFQPSQQPAVFQPISTMPGAKQEVIPPPPVLKFPTEDLDVPPRHDGMQRPDLRFFAEELPKEHHKNAEAPTKGMMMKSVGPLLDIWNTLNVHSEVFVLDSFTLDDFAEAMRFHSQELECILLNEIHCAVLKQVVDEKGEILVTLPELDEEGEGEEEEEEESENEEPEPDPEPLRRRTRSSFAKAEAIKEKSPSPARQVHRAAELLSERPWIDRLKARDLKNGAWVIILIGILHQLSTEERLKPKCDNILSKLVPMDEEPTDEAAIYNYNELDVNLRIEALHILVKLTIVTRAIRDHLERMSLQMTNLRKDKIEQQRTKKELVEELHQLDAKRKELASAVLPADDVEEEENGAAKENSPDARELNGRDESSQDSDDDVPLHPRRLRGGNDRSNDRKRKRVEAEAARKEKKAKAAAAKLTKEEQELRKLNTAIDVLKDKIKSCEDQINLITKDLRETECQRTKSLGRDRFCNRYYWFERNGMAYGGEEGSSTEHYGYANGRIWVQGPDAMEREGFIDLPEKEQQQYKGVHGVTVLERKAEEEGPTPLHDASEWGYLDEPDAVDTLIGWLDDRGNREKSLRKELQLWRDDIVSCMQKMRAHLDEVEARRAAGEEQAASTRVSTRTKTYVDLDATKWQCLAWTNKMALENLKQLHSDGGTKKGRRKGVAEKKEKIALGRNGKPLTRQGTNSRR